MTRILTALAAVAALLALAGPVQAGRTLLTTIDMATFGARCAEVDGVLDAALAGGQTCTLPSGAALRCAPGATGTLICEVLIERRGHGISAASLAAMPDGSPAQRLIAEAN